MIDKQQPLPRLRGTVKWFNESKGFGFIERDDKQPDVFVHFKAIAGTGYRNLIDGQRVEFSVGEGRGGRSAAIDVIKLKPEEVAS